MIASASPSLLKSVVASSIFGIDGGLNRCGVNVLDVADPLSNRIRFLLVDVDAQCLMTVTGIGEHQRKSDVAESDDGNDGILGCYFLDQRHIFSQRHCITAEWY